MKKSQINALAISMSVFIALIFFLLLDETFYQVFYLTAGSQALLGLSLYLVLQDKEEVETHAAPKATRQA